MVSPLVEIHFSQHETPSYRIMTTEAHTHFSQLLFITRQEQAKKPQDASTII